MEEDDINVDEIEQSEDNDDEESEFVMLESDSLLEDDIKDHTNEFFAAGYTGPTPNGQEYVRVIPE